ncbi:MAG: DsrE family protein [Desulfuromonadales bacterium]
MKYLPILGLALILLAQAPAVYALDDAAALHGLTAVRAVYDVRTNDEKSLQFMFKVIRDTYDETRAQNVTPRYVVSMRGPTVKMLVRSRAGDADLQAQTVAIIRSLIDRDIRLEACGYALNLFGVGPDALYKGVNAVGNSLNSLIGYQTRGYALVPMY